MSRADRRAPGIPPARSPIGSFIASAELIQTLTRQRIVLRYRGSLLGAAWILLAPALMMAIYTLVFGLIFQPRFSDGPTNTAEYALLLYLGLCAYWFMSECIAEAPGLVLQNANYVKKVVFPLDVLVWVSVCTALFHTAIRMLVYVAALLLMQGEAPATLWLLPLAWLPLVFLTVGVAWSLAAIGVFVRDAAEIVTLGLTALLFLSPVFYSVQAVPEAFRWLIRLNPISTPVEQIRSVAYFGTLPSPIEWLVSALLAYAVAWLGHRFFCARRGQFADVL